MSNNGTCILSNLTTYGGIFAVYESKFFKLVNAYIL